MGELSPIFNAPSTMIVCIDDCKDGRFVGRVIHKASGSQLVFEDVSRFLLDADTMFEQFGFPQASMKVRRFGSKRSADVQPLPRSGEVTNATETTHHGRIMTFAVQIRSRQNVSWQGKVYCVEADREVSFLSALELVKFIDTCLR